MSLAVRIIPCLDVRGGRVVKGINFKDIVDAGDPAEAAKRYDAEGADEICMLDIDASFEERSTTIETVKSIASQVFIPLTVGGGIKSLKDIDMLLKSGADKVSINTSAILNPDLIAEASKEYGAQCIVLAIDAKQDGEIWNVYTHGGKNKTELDAIDFTVSIVVERSSKDASISNMHISSAPSASYLLAASAGSPASTISLKLIPLTTLPPLTSKQGIIRTAKLIFLKHLQSFF